MSKLLPEQFTIAIAWLRSNESGDYEQAACEAVAAWLDQQEYNQMLRTEARKGGVPVAALRQRIARQRAAR